MDVISSSGEDNSSPGHPNYGAVCWGIKASSSGFGHRCKPVLQNSVLVGGLTMHLDM